MTRVKSKIQKAKEASHPFYVWFLAQCDAKEETVVQACHGINVHPSTVGRWRDGQEPKHSKIVAAERYFKDVYRAESSNMPMGQVLKVLAEKFEWTSKP